MTDREASGIVVLTAGGPLPAIIVNAVAERFGPVTVLTEESEPLRVLFGRRLKRLGTFTVAGQVAFGLLQRLLARTSVGRRTEIIQEHALKPDFGGVAGRQIAVGSVNSERCRAELDRLSPRVTLVVGTRMIARDTLNAIRGPVINYHAGINPKYRGMCGGYWSLAAGDEENFGVTAHLVDAGVDTGGVLYWKRASRTRRDNFATYPYLLAAAGRDVVIRSLEDALGGKLAPVTRDLPSQQWYHPTLWGYVWTGLRRGVW